MSISKMIIFTLILTQVTASQTRLVIDKAEHSHHLTFIQKSRRRLSLSEYKMCIGMGQGDSDSLMRRLTSCSMLQPRTPRYLTQVISSKILNLTTNAKISRSAENRADANVHKYHSNFVSTIVKDSYLQMCVKMWDGAGGLSGYLERLLLCSRLGTISR